SNPEHVEMRSQPTSLIEPLSQPPPPAAKPSHYRPAQRPADLRARSSRCLPASVSLAKLHSRHTRVTAVRLRRVSVAPKHPLGFAFRLFLLRGQANTAECLHTVDLVTLLVDPMGVSLSIK